MKTGIANRVASVVLGAGLLLGLNQAVLAEDRTGSVTVRVGATVVDPDSSADVFAGGARIAGADAEVSTEVVPSLTLAYFFTHNVAVELFCCFAKHEVDGKGTLNGIDLGDTWIFPPALTLQYHFDTGGAFKPYVGAGIQYINFFDESRSDLAGGARLDIDDAVGFTLQAGVDIDIGNGWFLNGDVKKTFLDTDASWEGTNVTADVDLDPWLFTAAVGRRFNLFGPAPMAPGPYK